MEEMGDVLEGDLILSVLAFFESSIRALCEEIE